MVAVKYLARKDSGLYMYQRRIPDDLRKHYPGKTHYKVSLKTYSEAEAAKLCIEEAKRVDGLWDSLRSPEAKAVGRTTPENTAAAQELLKHLGLEAGEAHSPAGPLTPQAGIAIDIFIDHVDRRTKGAFSEARDLEHQGQHCVDSSSMLTAVEQEASRLLMADPSQKRILLSDVLDSYLKHKGGGDKFDIANKRYVRLLTDAYGDLPLGEYTRKNVTALRDEMLAGGSKTATVKRYFKSLSAIFTHGIDEFDLKGVQNPFIRFKIPKDGQDAKVRPTFTLDELKRIQSACKEWDDTPRHIVAIQSDTGTRTSEIVGLRIEDIILGHTAPHVLLRESRELGRSLKSKNSSRKVPLVGMALWGVQRALKLREGVSKGWLFPQYATDDAINGDSASAAINKWLKKTLEIPKTGHSFRHTLADRLRHVDVRAELIDAIGGWKSYASMALNYGEGHLIEQLHREMLKVVAYSA
jgi:integrase